MIIAFLSNNGTFNEYRNVILECWNLILAAKNGAQFDELMPENKFTKIKYYFVAAYINGKIRRVCLK